MVASHRLNASAPGDSALIGRRDCRTQAGSPRLYLAVDNTRPVVAERGSGISVTLPHPLWQDAVGRADATVRHWRLAISSRLSRSDMATDLRLMVPAIVMAAAVVFGMLGAVRLAQGESGVDSGAGVVAGQQISLADSGAQAVGSAAGSFDTVIVVTSGESLWSIATERFPDEDPRRVVDLLVEANGGSLIQAGQRLVVPFELSTLD